MINRGVANFVPYPEEPVTPEVVVVSPEQGQTYAEQDVSLVFDVKEPELWKTGLTNPESWGEINWISYSIDETESFNITGTRRSNESNGSATVHCEEPLNTLSAGIHTLNVSVSSSCYYKPASEGMVGGPHYSTVVESYVVSFTVKATTAPAASGTDSNPSNIFGTAVIIALVSVLVVGTLIVTRRRFKQ